jgi:phage-related protein
MANWLVVSYRDIRGRVPVDDYLDSLQVRDRARILREIELLEDYGADLRMPHARHLRGKLWELRIDTRPNSYRVLYAGVVGRKFVLLHIFAKKGENTPESDMAIAERRLADYVERSGPDER